jgi:RNA polymerase sigma-70 factor (ECF subfamily)
LAGANAERGRLERIVRDNYDIIWRLARRWGLSAADADDVAQRTIVVAGRRLQEIETGRERAFLCRTALHLANKVRGSLQRRREESVEDWEEHLGTVPDPEQLLVERRARAKLDTILDQLPEPLRAVFVLFEIELLTQIEVAEVLGIPQGTVASRLRRAREAVAAQIERCARKFQKTGVSR